MVIVVSALTKIPIGKDCRLRVYCSLKSDPDLNLLVYSEQNRIYLFIDIKLRPLTGIVRDMFTVVALGPVTC